MRSFLLYICFFTIALQGFGQLHYGFDVGFGPSITGIKTDFPTDEYVFERYLNPMSVNLGASVDYDINDMFSLTTGLRLTSKGTAVNYSGPDSSAYPIIDQTWNQRIVFSTAYLRVPINVNISYDFFKNPNMVPFLRTGFALDLKLNNSGPSGLGTNPPDGFKYLKTFDASFVFSPGVQFKTNSGKHITANIGYYKGLINAVTDSYGLKNDEIKIFNNAILFEFGYRFE